MKYSKILSEKSQNLNDLAILLKKQYSMAEPFPHIQIDNFFSDEYLSTVLSEFPDLSKLKRKKEGSKKWSKPDICLFLGTRFRIYQSLNAKKRGPKQSNSCFGDLT